MSNHKMRFKMPGVQFVLIVLAVALSATALFFSIQNDRHFDLNMDESVQVTDAEAILERANDAVNFADGVLSFLEGVSVVVGVGVAAGAMLIRNTLQKQADSISEFAQQTAEFAQQTEARIQEREHRLEEIEASLDDRLNQMIEQTKQQIEAVQEQARKSFRVISLLVLAEQQVRAHNIDAALSMLEDAYTLDPDDQATNYLLGYLLTSRGAFDEAIEHLERALELGPNFNPARAALGLALRRKGDVLTEGAERNQIWGEAERKLLDALTKDPSLTDADEESYYGTLGGLYRRQKRYNAALDAYEQAQKITPNSSYPIINLAALHKHQGNEKQARHYFEQVLESARLQLDDDPRDLWTRADLAQAQLVLGHPDEALKSLHMVISQNAKRGLLETVLSGLKFLTEAPEPVVRLDEMILLIEQALGTLED